MLRENTNDVLIQLADTGVVGIREDTIAEGGCSTCDYGSNYGVEYYFTFSDGTKETFALEEMFEAPISEGQMITFLLFNLEDFKKMTKKEFIEYISDYENIIEED